MTKIDEERILAALIANGSIRAAAKAAGIAESTIRNRLADPVFRVRYDKLRSDLLQEATAGLTAKLDSATATISQIMEDDVNPASVRLAASDALLRHCLRYFSTAELERRIAALEAAQAELDGG